MIFLQKGPNEHGLIFFRFNFLLPFVEFIYTFNPKLKGVAEQIELCTQFDSLIKTSCFVSGKNRPETFEHEGMFLESLTKPLSIRLKKEDLIEPKVKAANFFDSVTTAKASLRVLSEKALSWSAY